MCAFLVIFLGIKRYLSFFPKTITHIFVIIITFFNFNDSPDIGLEDVVCLEGWG